VISNISKRLQYRKPHFLYIFIVIALSVQFTLGSVTGKLTGRVVSAETREELAGVNLIIKGTSLGVASNADGYFILLNIPPGTYDVELTMIGFAKLKVTDVKIVIDRTTEIGIELLSEVIGMEEITVVAKRPAIVRDISASQVNIESETIQALPVNDINSVIGLQAGIKDGLSIRGSSSRETTFMVDGFITNDERSNIPYINISLGSVNAVTVQTGGFNAEYGNVRSGVINVSTKEGSKDKYAGSVALQYRPPASKHFGPSVYDAYTYFLRPFMDDDICWTGTFNGAWDDYMQRQYPDFEGWNAVAQQTLQNDDPDDDLTPEAARQIFEFQHRRQGDITKPDYNIDLNFGGPVPAVSGLLGNLRFNFSYRDVHEMFIIPLSVDAYTDRMGRLKITSDIRSNLKMTLTGQISKTGSVSPYNWTTTPTGSVLYGDYSVANRIGSSSGDATIYMPGWFSPTEITRTLFGINLNRIVSNDTYYTIFLQHNVNNYNTYQTKDRDTSKVYEIIDGYFLDEAPYGYWGKGTTSIDGMITGGWMNLGRDSSAIATTTFKFDIHSQLNKYNEAQAGFLIAYNDYNIKSSTINPSMTTWNRDQIYNLFPFRIEAYTQDKLEFKGFIANLGLRGEYSDPNTQWYVLDAYDKYYQEYYGLLMEEEVETEDSKPTFRLSPRLGVSYPITDYSKLYFNYGHFHTEPSSTYRFRLQREYSGLVTSIGNPNLSRERTIAYEIGYSQAVGQVYLLNLAAYYKDITDQPGWINYWNLNRSVQYSTTANNFYEDIRGIEITLEKKKRSDEWLSGFVNYTYMVTTSGYFGYTEYWEDPQDQADYLSQNPYQDKPAPQPYARANLDIQSPSKFGPNLAGTYLLGGWNCNLLFTWEAGEYDTYNPTNESFIHNNVQWKDTYNIDMRLKKEFSFSNNISALLYVDVSNLLNTKILSYAGFSDSYDESYYMESLLLKGDQFGDFKGHDRIGEYRDDDVGFVPLRSYGDINTIGTPVSRVLYYDELTERYLQYENSVWVERSKSWVQEEIIDTKAYIDMPNLGYFRFLYPRDIKIGINVNF